ncbi:MAG: molybdate ABC transporter substrate-binding protein [Coriobacteriales bacterium]|jgi:molybdate transport system substrate-binding protein
MKKNLKWLMTIVASAAIVSAFALAGCSGGGEQAPAEDAAADAAAAPADGVQLQVFAANSLSKAMDEAQALYTEQTGVTFADTQYLSSGDLNAELEAGAYADIEITASNKTMDDAEEAGYIDPATRITMFKNDLVMVTSADNADITEVTLDDIATGQYTVAIGDDSVPAGNYANQALSTVGCFNDPEGAVGADSTGKAGDAGDAAAYAGTPLEGKYTLADSVGNVCSLAETGDVDIAFVYTSDVERFGGVKVVGTVPADTHKNITYPGAVCAQSKNAEAAQAFIDWCMTDAGAAEIWQKWAFELASE